MRRGLLVGFGKGVPDDLGYVFDGGVLAEFTEIGGVCNGVEAQFAGDLALYAQDGSDLLLGEEEDLEHEVVALVGTFAHAGLAHEDEAGKEEGFDGDEGAQERKGLWIEARDGSNLPGVDAEPEEEGAEVHQDKGETAGEGGNIVAEALGPGAGSEELLLVSGDDVDVFLNVVERHGLSLPCYAGGSAVDRRMAKVNDRTSARTRAGRDPVYGDRAPKGCVMLDE